MSPKIIFLVDHKHRDLQSLALIGFFLKKQSWRVFFLPLDTTDLEIDKIKPDFIVLPKPTYNIVNIYNWKSKYKKLKIIIILTEANSQHKKYKFKILSPIDYIIFWDLRSQRKYIDLLETRKIFSRVLGYYRSDFFHPKFSKLYPSRNKLIKNLKINKNNFNVTIATSAQDAFFSTERINKKRKRRNSTLSETVLYDDILKNKILLKDLCMNFILEFSKKNPNINILIKPHPNENIIEWNKFVKKISRPNVKLILGKSINEFLILSDFHISFAGCTSTAEAGFLNLPTLELYSSMTKKIFASEHLRIAKYTSCTPQETSNYILNELFKKKSKKIDHLYKERIKKYIKRNFFIFDGNRCKSYALSINEYWKNSLDGKIPKSKLPFYIFLFVKSYVTYINLKSNFLKLFVQKKNLLDQVNRPNLKNTRPYEKIGSILVDSEFGLFDNRIRNGDEKFWFNKYRDLFNRRKFL